MLFVSVRQSYRLVEYTPSIKLAQSLEYLNAGTVEVLLSVK